MQTKKSALNEAQTALVESSTRQGMELLQQYGIDASGGVAADLVGKAMDAWMKDRSANRLAPDEATAALGVLFGNCYLKAGFQWFHVTDDYGEALCVSNAGGMIAYPIDAVRKRMGQPGGGAEIVSVFDATSNQMLAGLAKHISRQSRLEVPLPEQHREARDLLTPAAFMKALAELGLNATIPERAELNLAETDWFPADVETPAGIVRTGFTLSIPSSWEAPLEPLDEKDEALLGKFMGGIKSLFGGGDSTDEEEGDDDEPQAFEVTARYAAGADENETPFIWFAAAAIASIYGSTVVDPESDDEPLDATRLREVLAEQKAKLDPAKSRRKKDYPYDLFRAIEKGDVDAVGRALDSGAPIDSISVHGESTICTAIRFEHMAVATLLVERGVSLKAPYPGGLSALEAAKDSGNKQLVTLIRKKLKG